MIPINLHTFQIIFAVLSLAYFGVTFIVLAATESRRR